MEKCIFTPPFKTKTGRGIALQGHPEVLWEWLSLAPAKFFAKPLPKNFFQLPPPERKAVWEQWERFNKRRFEHLRNRALKKSGHLIEKAEAEKLGVLPRRLPHNWARHSFATYHLALHKNAPLTAYLISHHRGEDTLNRFYRKQALEKDAVRYFSLTPAYFGLKSAPCDNRATG